VKLAEHYRVKLVWVPGHRRLEGNEIVDQLGKLGTECTLMGPEPAYGISAGVAKKAVRDWTETTKNTGSP
jgi:ribonuclease HI